MIVNCLVVKSLCLRSTLVVVVQVLASGRIRVMVAEPPMANTSVVTLFSPSNSGRSSVDGSSRNSNMG